jgi:hypothetical protein
MTDFPSDDARLRATETQMRHALGLHGGAPTRSPAGGSPSQRHRFVRDGEVPVTVIRRDYQPDGEHGANQLDATRQAIRSEATARGRAERSLNEAQAMIRDLQTKLGHERLAKDEALASVRRLEVETRAAAHAQETAEAELAAERLARRNAEDALVDALEARQEAERSHRDAMAVEMARKAPQTPHGLAYMTTATQTAPAALDTEAEPDTCDTARPPVPAIVKKRRIPAGSPDTSTATSDRDYSGPASDGNQDSDIVEWWKPGWRDRHG